MGACGAGGAAADPEAISQSNFEAWFQSGTLSTFTYEDSTYGNYLVLASPGSNTFKEHNSISHILAYLAFGGSFVIKHNEKHSGKIIYLNGVV